HEHHAQARAGVFQRRVLDAQDALDDDGDAGLLARLALAGLHEGLARLDASAGPVPALAIELLDEQEAMPEAHDAEREEVGLDDTPTHLCLKARSEMPATARWDRRARRRALRTWGFAPRTSRFQDASSHSSSLAANTKSLS